MHPKQDIYSYFQEFFSEYHTYAYIYIYIYVIYMCVHMHIYVYNAFLLPHEFSVHNWKFKTNFL